MTLHITQYPFKCTWQPDQLAMLSLAVRQQDSTPLSLCTGVSRGTPALHAPSKLLFEQLGNASLKLLLLPIKTVVYGG